MLLLCREADALDAGRQPALVAVSSVAVNDVLVDHAVDHRHSGTIGALCVVLAAFGDRIVDLADRGAHARAQRDIVSAVLDGLSCCLFRRFGIRHAVS
jgi:hypothetical protein